MEIRAERNTYRGTGVARWGWSGVEELRLPWVSDEILQRIVSLLPARVSTVEEIGFTIIEFGARYHRNLHQDEFGPTRADRMSALRTMLIRVELLDSLIVGLPQHLALELSYRSTEPDPSPSFRILRSWTILRGWTIGEIHRAANTELAVRHSLYSADDLYLLEEICTRASATIEVMCLLDTSTDGELFVDTVSTGLLIVKNARGVDVFSIIEAPLYALKVQIGLTLDRLEQKGGPERQISLSWLVWETCDLWTRETGQPVTNSAIREGGYTSRPQSPAGQFVLAVVEALQPPGCWIAEKLPRDASVRARKFAASSDGQARSVYSAMRDYVTGHPPIGIRRGRRKVVR